MFKYFINMHLRLAQYSIVNQYLVVFDRTFNLELIKYLNLITNDWVFIVFK